jgi:hypothetical protein
MLVVIDLNRVPGGMIDYGSIVGDQNLVLGDISDREDSLLTIGPGCQCWKLSMPKK